LNRYQADLARFYLLDPILLKRRLQSKAKAGLFLVLLVMYQLSMLLAVLVMGIGQHVLSGSLVAVRGQGGMGSIGSKLWLASLVVSTAELYSIVLPLFNWLCHATVSALMGARLQRISDILRTRGRSILLRGSGIMHNYSALIHHFNPACRAARAFPELSISRLLLTLNDWDLPEPRRSSSTEALSTLVMPVQMVLTLYMRIPISLRMLISRLVFVVVINMVLLSLVTAYGVEALYYAAGAYILGVLHQMFLKDVEFTWVYSFFEWLQGRVEAVKNSAVRAAVHARSKIVAQNYDEEMDQLAEGAEGQSVGSVGLRAKPTQSPRQMGTRAVPHDESGDDMGFTNFYVTGVEGEGEGVEAEKRAARGETPAKVDPRAMPDPNELPSPTIDIALEDTMLIVDANKTRGRLPPIVGTDLSRSPKRRAATRPFRDRRARAPNESDLDADDDVEYDNDGAWRRRRATKSRARSRHSFRNASDYYDDSDRESGDRSDGEFRGRHRQRPQTGGRHRDGNRSGSRGSPSSPSRRPKSSGRVRSRGGERDRSFDRDRGRERHRDRERYSQRPSSSAKPSRPRTSDRNRPRSRQQRTRQRHGDRRSEREREGEDSLVFGGSMSSDVDVTDMTRELSTELLEGSFAGLHVGDTPSVLLDTNTTQLSTDAGAPPPVRRTAFGGFEQEENTESKSHDASLGFADEKRGGVSTPGPSTSLSNTPVGSQVLFVQESTADVIQEMDQQPAPEGAFLEDLDNLSVAE